MIDSADWPVQLSTTVFVAHPDQLDVAQELYVQRLNAIPAEHAQIHFHSDYPCPRSDEFELWQLRCTAVYEAMHLDLPDLDLLELFEVHCILGINPEFQEEVAEKLFFADHSAPDPFAGSGESGRLTPFVPGATSALRPARPRVAAAPDPAPVVDPQPAAVSWLATLYILAGPGEDEVLATEYSRLLTEVPGQVPDATLTAASSAPWQMDDASSDAIAGPLWLADTRRAVADPAAVTMYPVARRLHRARLIIASTADPLTVLPAPRLPGTWETEPLS